MLPLRSIYSLLLSAILVSLVVASARGQETHSQDTTFFNAARDGDDRTLRRVLDAGADPNVDNIDGWTPLMLAAMNGNAGGVKILLERGADPDFGEADQGPPLAVAAMSPFVAFDEVSIIRLMIDKGASIDIPNGAGMTPLMYAAREGNFVRAAYLIERGANVNHRDTRGWTPLRFAASVRSVDVVRLLIAHGAIPDALDEGFRTPLHYAATERSTEIATILLDAMADPNGVSVTGGYPSPIALAAALNDSAMIVLLAKRGATPNYSDMGSNNDGIPRTPLDWTRHYRNRTAERALVAAGAVSNADLLKVSREMLKVARRGDEKSFAKFLAKKIDPRVAISADGVDVFVLDEASAMGNLTIVGAILASRYKSDPARLLASYRRASAAGHPKVASVLLTHMPGPLAMLAIVEEDVDLFEQAFKISPDLVRYRDENGRTPLHAAALAGDTSIVSQLLARGADIAARETWKETPLFDAARSGSVEVVKLLLDRKADITARNLRGFTILHAAARLGHTEVVELLASEGVDVNAADEQGWRPLHHAAWIGSEPTIRALVAHGATRDARNKHQQVALDIARDMHRDDAVKQLLQ